MPAAPFGGDPGSSDIAAVGSETQGKEPWRQGAKWTHGGAAEKEAMAKPKERERTKAKGLKAEEDGTRAENGTPGEERTGGQTRKTSQMAKKGSQEEKKARNPRSREGRSPGVGLGLYWA